MREDCVRALVDVKKTPLIAPVEPQRSQSWSMHPGALSIRRRRLDGPAASMGGLAAHQAPGGEQGGMVGAPLPTGLRPIEAMPVPRSIHRSRN